MKIENKFQKTEDKYRAIFVRSRDAIILTDNKAKITDVNQAGLDILGYKSKEEILALKSAFTLFESREYLIRFQQIVAKEGFVTEFETRIVGKDKRIFDALITSNVIADITGAATSYVFIIRDISKRKKTQLALEMRNLRLATLNKISETVNSSLDLKEILQSTANKILELLQSDSVRIYLLEKKNKILNLAAHTGLSERFINKKHMIRRKIGDGYLGQTVITKKTNIVDNYLRNNDPYVDSFIEEGLQSTVYIPLVSKEKPLGVICASSLNKIKFSADHVKLLVAIGNHIGLAVDNANLYKNVKTAYEELKEAQEIIIRTEKLASLGKLAATIAHEINNPIAAVLNYIRLMKKLILKKSFTTKKIEDISRYLNTMDEETTRCGEIVKNLLSFSRQSGINKQTYNIEEIINKALVLIGHTLMLRGERQIKNIEPELPKVKCDFKQIQQVFLNLFSNAIESMSSGGTLTVTAKKSAKKGFVEIAVSDTGVGISKKNLKNIFEPFFTTKEECKGVGLGLSVVYGIITRHNGSIKVESKLNQGSVFTVFLPTGK